jgi:hypothetical protein
MSKEGNNIPVEDPEVIAKQVSENNPPIEETKEDSVLKETSESDPLAEQKGDSENQTGSNLESDLEESETDSGSDLEETGKDSKKPLEDLEKPLEDTGSHLEDLGKDSKTDLEGAGNDSEKEETVTKTESTEDPLAEEEDPEPSDPEEPEVSDEYREWMSKMAINSINYIDELKTQICVAFGGGYASDYATSSFVKNSLISSAKELAQQKEMGAPSPMQMFMMSLIAMTAPPIMLVLFRRNIRPALNNPTREKVEASEEAQAQTDYKNTVEYKEGRDQFKVHPNGAYMYGLGGREDYVSANIADAYPSPEVQKLIDENLKPAKIKKIIYG